jgi:hypothetical protein
MLILKPGICHNNYAVNYSYLVLIAIYSVRKLCHLILSKSLVVTFIFPIF